MSLVTHGFDLPIMPGSISPVLHLSQYDDARAFTAHLKDESGNPFTLPSSATAKLEGMNCKGVTFDLEATPSGSDLTFTPKEAATDQPGLIAATLHITNGDDNISTLAVILNVQRGGATKEDVARSPGFVDALQAAVEAWASQQGFQSPTVTVTPITGGNRVTFTDKDGTETMDVLNGKDGDSGVLLLKLIAGSNIVARCSTSQWISAASIQTEVEGGNMPFLHYEDAADGKKSWLQYSGGATNQAVFENDYYRITVTDSGGTTAASVSVKQVLPTPAQGDSGKVPTVNSDGEYELQMPSGGSGLPSGGTTGQVLKKTSDGAAWGDEKTELPSGGLTGQVLKKTASGVAWENESGGAGGAFEIPITSATSGGVTTYSTTATAAEIVAHAPNLCVKFENVHYKLSGSMSSNPNSWYVFFFSAERNTEGAIETEWFTIACTLSTETIEITKSSADVPSIPFPASSNNGKVLGVVSGAYALVDSAVPYRIQIFESSPTPPEHPDPYPHTNVPAATLISNAYNCEAMYYNDLYKLARANKISSSEVVLYFVAESDGGADGFIIHAVSGTGGFVTVSEVDNSITAETPRVAMASTDTSATIDPNKLYVFPEMASLAITLAAITDNTIVNEYHFIFESGATATTTTFPAIPGLDDFAAEANMAYEVSILEGRALVTSWEVSTE